MCELKRRNTAKYGRFICYTTALLQISEEVINLDSHGPVATFSRKVCAACTKPFYIPTRQLKWHKWDCCSRECRDILGVRKLYDKRDQWARSNPNWKGGRSASKQRYYDKRQLNVIRDHKFVDSYLESHPCVDCGEADIAVLQFDHVRGVKRRNVSAMVCNGCTIELITTEIEKCDVRCANCHLRVTKSRGQAFARRRLMLPDANS